MMFFRDELKETMEALKLTQELEFALKKSGARGSSLSDMIKSHERLEREDFDEAYEYRAYKRSLLHGRYNALRWVAHERNQLMHQSNYLISNFTKFKYTTKDAIKYISSQGKRRFTYEWLVLRFTALLPYLIVFGVAVFYLWERVLSSESNPFLMAFFIALALGLILRFGEVLANLLELFYRLYTALQKLATQHKLSLMVLFLAFLFWGREISYFKELF